MYVVRVHTRLEPSDESVYMVRLLRTEALMGLMDLTRSDYDCGEMMSGRFHEDIPRPDVMFLRCISLFSSPYCVITARSGIFVRAHGQEIVIPDYLLTLRATSTCLCSAMLRSYYHVVREHKSPSIGQRGHIGLASPNFAGHHPLAPS